MSHLLSDKTHILFKADIKYMFLKSAIKREKKKYELI